jgi:broad specificity phosphatase PhoE
MGHAVLLPLLLMAGADPASLGPVPAGAVRVYLVRHAEAFSNLTPPPTNMTEKDMDALTDKGRQQAEAVGAALRPVNVAAVFFSPTNRTRQTAEGLRGERTLEAREERELRRIDNGKSQSGKPLELADRVAIWKAGQDTRPLEGESMVDLGKRMLALVQSLRKPYAGKGVVCVTHAEPISALVGELRGTPGAMRYPPGIPLASVTVLEVSASGVKEVLFKYEPGSRVVSVP